MNDKQRNELKKFHGNGTKTMISMVSNVFIFSCESRTYPHTLKSEMTIDELVGDSFCGSNSGKIKINQNGIRPQNLKAQNLDYLGNIV